jgi:alkylation response protein AidB-like acyl-CoA dehydrogenase
MFRRDTPQEAQFRNEVRSWLEANLPHPLRGRTTRPHPNELMPFYHTLSRKGWIAPHWPKKYGGMGATLNEQIIMAEEMAHVGAPNLPVQGLNHIGPILMEFGNEAQKARHLPPIIEGSVIWAQGYSEPGAGSDLASLATRAVPQGDHFVVNGQKIWTTWAHHSDWIYALVRTDPEAQPRHAGISFLLIDLHSPGIKVRPIKTIAGDDEFAEVFFDGVVVPAENLVGKLNEGWRIANALLGHERIATSNPQFSLMAL